MPAYGLHLRAFGAGMSMDACATGIRSQWTLKRVRRGKTALGICDGLHANLDGQPTSGAFGGFVAGFGEFTSGRRSPNALQGELRCTNRGAVVTRLPRLDYEGAVLVITLDREAGTVRFDAPQHRSSHLGVLQIEETNCSSQAPLHLYVQVWRGASWEVIESACRTFGPPARVNRCRLTPRSGGNLAASQVARSRSPKLGAPVKLKCALCLHNNPASAKFCNQCGDVLEIRHEMKDDMKIQGFFYGSGGLKFADDDWDGLRASLLEFIARTGCKDGPPDSDVEGPRDFEKSIGAIEVIEDFGEKVWCLQTAYATDSETAGRSSN